MKIVEDILYGNPLSDPVDGDLLVLCIQAGNVSSIEKMTRDPNAPLPNGLTPIEYSVRLNRYDITKELLKKGADPNIHYYCYPPLMETRDLNMVRLLLENRANPDIVDERGRTPLMNSFDPELVRLLLDYGASLDLQDKYGLTALHHLNITDNPEISRILKQRGASVELEDNTGLTAAGYALCVYKLLYFEEIL
jgi:ankyrin repeat protein